MKDGSSDRRVKQTRIFLKQSLLDLMKERPVTKITVKDICERADVNRGTFYAHYSDPSDLLSQIENELFDEISVSLEKSLKTETVSALLLEIFGSIRQNGDLCRILFSEYGDKDFLKRIVNIARDRCLEEWKAVMKDADTAQLERLYAYSANGSIGILQQWIQEGFKEAPSEIASFIEKVSNSGIRAFFPKVRY